MDKDVYIREYIRQYTPLLADRGEILVITGDYRNTRTPLDFEIQEVRNGNDTVMVSKYDFIKKVESGTWKIINVRTIKR